jgi:hypothetical protein
MLTFTQAMQEAEATGVPVVEGIAVELAAKADAAAVKAKVISRFPDYKWADEELPDGWWIYRVVDRTSKTAPLYPPLGRVWDAMRELEKVPGVRSAEPLLLTRPPVANGSDARESFALWGRVNGDRLKQIVEKSGKDLHWSIDQMRLTDVNGQKGAWTLWKERHGNKEPGNGILIAHPDTGYTRHKRLLPRLAVRPGDPQSHHGRNFVERDLADAATNGFDPMKDRSTGNFPGHGTGTASVIAAGRDANEPWGVAPGARIIPLRVSSSVIHLSFQNVSDAFFEAMQRGAHVISMSLGGPLGSGLLNSLVRRALDQGIIVVSAAGNFAPLVVFPARVPGVLGCAASNVLQAAWRFSGMGSEVAITAPGELVWHDLARIQSNGPPVDGRINTSGTSFATANVAGLAALWLSFHGRKSLIDNHCGGKAELLPFLFRLCLQRSADPAPEFIRQGKGGFGAGIARADRLLLQPFPPAAEVAKEREEILRRKTDSVVSVSSLRNVLTLPTLAEAEPPRFPDETELQEREEHIRKFLLRTVGDGADDRDLAEIGTLAAIDTRLLSVLARAARRGLGDAAEEALAATLRRYLLRDKPLSDTLRGKLSKARTESQETWNKAHPELAVESRYPLPPIKEEEAQAAYTVPEPPLRRLRAYAFDPSLATRTDDAAINEITVPVMFERDLRPGPVGDYLEVVDIDPASNCAYAPVDLNHPFLLGQDGLPRSEGNPQFHQQMVYAVAMKTIQHFEEALGRPIFWSPLRPWDEESGDDARSAKGVRRDQFVQRLRLYPHALREQNAFYSPQKRAILFGYFPAGDGDPGTEFPGGAVFTCLAHDIIAHEMTHAILDGMHVRFVEPTNPDVLAFHEAFADIVALFQRFTYTELLRDQISKARGRLDAGTLMTRLALQFGQATGRHQALRDALGRVVEQARKRNIGEWRDLVEETEMDGSSEQRVTLADAASDGRDEEIRHLWKRFQADPSLLAQVEEPHERGSFLVAAVFDAYIRIYERRVADLRRIATGGTGILPEGDLHPDLVGRMAREAAKSARHVLKMCIRAMDYVPPTDITFGEFLRALITADYDLVPNDDLRYRVAFVEAFRKWGIYPRDVRTLSEETLRWSPPPQGARNMLQGDDLSAFQELRRALFDWEPGQERRKIFDQIREMQAMLHGYLKAMDDGDDKRALLGGIDTRRSFHVTNLRPARRIGPRGEYRTEMVVEVLQRKDALRDSPPPDDETTAGRRSPFRGGVTLIVGLEKDKYVVRYAIYKRLDSAAREARQRDFLLRAGGGSSEAAEYSSQGLPEGWFSDAEVKKAWLKERTSSIEDMRASSCNCRRLSMDKAKNKKAAKARISIPNGLTEPFALLHRG